MIKVLILGSGNIGSVTATLLQNSGDYAVTLASRNRDQLHATSLHSSLITLHLNIHADALLSLFQKFHIIVSALPFYENITIAELALQAGVSYFDLTEDRKTTKNILSIAKKAQEGQVFMPQCGLAPGAIGIIGHGLSQDFETIREIKMRVGALPLYPSNKLKYNLSWSTQGLINEYCQPCQVLYNGEVTEVLPLEGLEHFTLDGLEYEAFNTSGGLGRLSETLQGKAEDLSYKSIRYKGHCDLMHFLLHDLNFIHDQKGLKKLLENNLPKTKQDVVLLYITITGVIKGSFQQRSYTKKIYHNSDYTAIEITTAHGLCAAIDLFVSKQLPQKGFIAQEEIALDVFLKNRFGMLYQSDLNGDSHV